MTSPDPSSNADGALRELGQVIYEARIKEAWGPNWINRPQWPADAEAWRAYPHNPIADVDLALASARAAFAWFARTPSSKDSQ